MKIKYRITLLFTVVVTGILLLLCASVLYFSALKRQTEFRKRLRNRAMTTASLLVKVPGIDKDLLKKIDESTFAALQEKSVIIYDDEGKLLYYYFDKNAISEPATQDIIERVKKYGDYYYTEGKRDVIVLQFANQNNKYIVVEAAYDKDGFEKLEELKWILIFSFVTGILITFISGLFFSKGLVIPIKKITNEVKEISSQNLSRRIDIREPKDELNELASTFNELMDRLQESFETQRRFIANASHELSTPLTSILNQLEITLQNERPAPEYKEVIISVYEDVRNLTQLTKSLLEIAKASGSSAGIELTIVRIDELLMRLPLELKRTNSKYFVELHFDAFPEDEDKLLLFGNSDLLYSAVKNIVSNACKYSETHIAQVSLHFLGDSLEVKIQDDGPGISEVDLPFIFQPFFRGDTVNNKYGFGLGLSLASKIISIHKGNINYQNKKEGGAIFSIKLPIAKSFHEV